MKIIKTLISSVLLLFLIVSCSEEEVEIQELGAGFDQEKMNLFFSNIEEKNLGMGSVSIYKNGQQEYKTAFGKADIENSVDATTETKYRIASITKTFTASLVMQLIEEGKLTLNTSLATFFPQMPNAEKINIELMLRHRSGLFNYTNREFTDEEVGRERIREEILEILVENGTVFEPDARAEYSNTNYMLLTFIIEDIEEIDYSEVLKSRIIEPLELGSTQYGDIIDTDKNEAASYFFENDNWVKARETHISNARGTGGIVSVPTDVCEFYNALFTGSIVSENSLLQMQTPVDNFGLGMFPIRFNNKNGFGHDGRIDGFRSVVVYFPSDRVTLAYNTNAENMLMNDILIGILSIYSGLDYELP